MYKISIPFRIMWIKTILALSLLVTWIDCAPLDVHGCDSCNTGKNIYPKYYKHWYILWHTQLIGNVDILWGGNLSMMFYSSSHECNKSFEVTSRRRVTLKTCSMNDLTSKTSYWDCRSHRICIVEKYNQAIITGQKTRQMNALSMQSGKYWLKVASIGFYLPL